MASIPTIDNLKAQVTKSGGPALANLYFVELPQVPGATLSAEERNLLCKATRIPGRQMATLDRQLGIENQKIVNGYAVAEVTLAFHLMNDYKVRQYFEAWQQLAVDQQNQQIKYSNEYKFPVKIYQMRKIPTGTPGTTVSQSSLSDAFGALGPQQIVRTSANIVYGVELDKAFPVTMNGIDLADASENTVVELSVDLSYKNWKRIQ